jgi:molybdate transport system permease protein
MPLNWSPLWLSLRVAGIATAGALLPGLWLAHLLATRSFTGRKTVFAILAVLLATPVVIVASRLVHPALPWPAGAAAGVLAALPFVALGAQSSLRALDQAYGNAARSLGTGEWRLFFRVILPLGWRPVLAAVSVAFLRVLAEWTVVATCRCPAASPLSPVPRARERRCCSRSSPASPRPIRDAS